MLARISAALLAATLTLPAPATRAHQAPGGWDYAPGCCGGDTTGQTQRGDCAPVPDEAVREISGGWAVTITDSMRHPVVPAGAPPVHATIRHGDPRVLPSPDGYRHVCLSPASKSLLCLYVPPGSS